MQTITITTSQNIDIDYEVAGLGQRILARLVDYGVFIGVYFVLAICMGIYTATMGSNTHVDQAKAFGAFPIIIIVFIATYLFLYVFYDLVCEIFLNGQSIGKRAIKIKVVSLNGARPTVGQYLLRWVFRIIDFIITLGSGALICVALSNKKQRIGDMVAGTTLVSLVPQTGFNDLVFSPPPADYEPQYTQVAQLTDDDIVLIHDVIRNFNRTRNSGLVYKLALKIKSYLNISYPPEINEYQFLEIVLNDYNTLTAKSAV